MSSWAMADTIQPLSQYVSKTLDPAVAATIAFFVLWCGLGALPPQGGDFGPQTAGPCFLRYRGRASVSTEGLRPGTGWDGRAKVPTLQAKSLLFTEFGGEERHDAISPRSRPGARGTPTAGIQVQTCLASLLPQSLPLARRSGEALASRVPLAGQTRRRWPAWAGSLRRPPPPVSPKLCRCRESMAQWKIMWKAISTRWPCVQASEVAKAPTKGRSRCSDRLAVDVQIGQ
jgi:hypothetical protein